MQRVRRRVKKRTADECFGQTLRELRKHMGLTQEELAFKSGYHPTYIGQLERGRKNPSLRTILSLASVLDSKGSELVRRVEAMMAADFA